MQLLLSMQLLVFFALLFLLIGYAVRKIFSQKITLFVGLFFGMGVALIVLGLGYVADFDTRTELSASDLLSGVIAGVVVLISTSVGSKVASKFSKS